MKPYPDYKPTGLAWLPEIPRHWKCAKIRELFTERIQKVSDKEFAPLSVSKGGIVPQIATVAKTDNGDNRKRVKVGDFVINSRSDRKGSSGISAYDGSVSLINIVLNPRAKENGRFLHYLLKSIPFTEEYYRNGRGIVADLWTTRYSEMKTISVPVPPADEQAQIVRYLDAMTAKINKLIRAKKRQIALLQEQKQAIINQAVTRGLDPDVELKDSGIDWLGPIPKHWDCRTIRRCSRYVKTGGTPSGVYEDYFQEDGFNWYTPGDLGEELWLSDSIRQLSELGKSQVKIFPPNTIMMIGIGGTIGKVAICSNSASCNQQISGIVVSEDMNVIYVAHCLKSLRNYILSTGKYTTLPIINQEEIKTLSISIPPLDEQNKISKFLCSKTQRFEKILKKIKKEIGIILEYKNSLIASVITGQVDVRNIAVEEVDPADLITDDVAISSDDDIADLSEESPTTESEE